MASKSKSTSAKPTTAKAPRVRKPKAPKLHPEMAAAEATMPADVKATAPAAAKVEAVPPVVEGKRKIEKDREERNGVKRPSVGGACRAVWDFCDDQSTPDGVPSVKDVKAEAEARGWNVNNASIEYYQWRKFMGIRGRQGKAAAATSEATAG